MFEYLFWNYFIFFLPLFYMQNNLNPGHCKASRLHGCSSACIGDPEENAALPGAPSSRKISHQVSPAAHTKIQMEQNPSLISGSTTLLSLESETISCDDDDDDNDDDDDEDTCSSAASNSFASPEIFRKETSSM